MSALTTAQPGFLASDPFAHQRFTIKRPWLSFLGRRLYVHGPDGRVVMFVRHKLMTLRDEWNVYSDESQTTALLRVKARQALAMNVITDVVDAASGQPVGAVRNKGLKSLVRDTWELLGEGDREIGRFVEDSNALLRRFIPMLLGHWHLEVGGQEVARLHQQWRWFAKEFTLEITAPGQVDNKLVLGCALLALMREMAREAR